MPKSKRFIRLKREHEQSLEYFKNGQLPQSANVLVDLLKHTETAELWNDWATVQFIRGMIPDAERGYRRALELEPTHQEAALNFGILLAATGNEEKAAPLLQHAVKSLKGKQRLKITKIIDQCRQKAERASSAP